MIQSTEDNKTMVGNLMVGIVGSNCVVIASEKFHKKHNSMCSLNGKITVAWSGNLNNSLIDRAKLYTNSEHGMNSPACYVAEFLIDPEIRVLNNLPSLPYTESFMIASCDKNEKCLYITDTYGTISHVLASAIGRNSDVITNFLHNNYSSISPGILGAIEFALRTLCVVIEPNSNFIEVSVTAFGRPFEIVDDSIVNLHLARIISTRKFKSEQK